MIKSASEIYFRNFPNEVAEAELAVVLSIYEEAAKCRNNIAHGIGGGDQDDTGEIWNYLVPNTWGSKSRDKNLKVDYRYSSKQIEQFAEGFRALSGRAFQLVDVLVKTYQKAPERSRTPY